ncbi:HTH_Tnp_Tc3_2 domain-containing protein [Trichonephila clavipes]|nr:HTH_Tnp_Tc3_2 domain-containing protein [Trichonephila clavipes]
MNDTIFMTSSQNDRRCVKAISGLYRYHTTIGRYLLIPVVVCRVSRVYQEYIDGRQKTSNPANCKGQLASTVRGQRRLRRVVRSQHSQPLAHIITQLKYCASRTVSKWTVQLSLHRMGFGSRRPLNDRFGLHVLLGQRSTETRV